MFELSDNSSYTTWSDAEFTVVQQEFFIKKCPNRRDGRYLGCIITGWRPVDGADNGSCVCEETAAASNPGRGIRP